MSRQEFHVTIDSDGARIIDILAAHSELPKQRIKDALNKGAVWLRTRGREQRLRRATKILQRGTQVSLYYDAELLQREPPPPTFIADEKSYSVWYKPAGMLAQGTHFGDHCALLRWSEKYFTPAREFFLVHRLDREAEGLMLIAHNGAAASAFSTLWQQNQIHKQYRVVVEGLVGEIGSTRRIETPLDEKMCATEFSVTALDEKNARSILTVNLITGRKHQIRRHLAGIGFPVVGDYRYGNGRYGNNGAEPLALRAVMLQFRCPLSGHDKNYYID